MAVSTAAMGAWTTCNSMGNTTSQMGRKITAEWNDGQWCAHKWLAAISNKIWEINKELWEHRNDVLHKNNNAVRKADNERLAIDIANIIEEIKLIPQQFLPATDKCFFQQRTITKNQHTQKEMSSKEEMVPTSYSTILYEGWNFQWVADN